MLMEPKVLLLDEPSSGTTGADREQLRTLITGIREQGIGVALIDHDVKFVSDISDTVLAMNYRGTRHRHPLGTARPRRCPRRLHRPGVRHQATDDSKPRSVHSTEILNLERTDASSHPKTETPCPVLPSGMIDAHVHLDGAARLTPTLSLAVYHV
jgi:energy-coupling factor transporter ATP-binding protein EcfA2